MFTDKLMRNTVYKELSLMFKKYFSKSILIVKDRGQQAFGGGGPSFKKIYFLGR